MFEQAFASRRAHVLIVEDDPDLRGFLASTFAGAFRVEVFADGRDAIGASNEVGAAIIDLGLPGMRGEDVARHLRDRPNPPTIVLISDDAQRLNSASPLADAILVKPFQRHVLLALVCALGMKASGTDPSSLASLPTE